MSTIYIRASEDVYTLAESVMRKFHPQFIDAALKVDLLFAVAGIDEETGQANGPAIKVGGYAAHAYCRIIPLKDRVMDRGDAEIVIDGDHWGDWSESQQEALLDHELHHIIIQTSRGGALIMDDIGRPKLKMRKHDHQFGWFKAIAQRHGAASFECQQAKKLTEDAQVYFQPELFPASQTTQDHVENFVRQIRRSGNEVTISTGDQLVTIGAKEANLLRKAADVMAGGAK